MKAAVIVFPGSNCDRDMARGARSGDGSRARHGLARRHRAAGRIDLVVLPGGFSYGDYLRCGAIAAHSPVMREVVRMRAKGGAVLGICNGFQI